MTTLTATDKTMTPEMSALKTRLKATWESGDYSIFARYLEDGALDFFNRLNIPSGALLLDVACGAGQLTLPAARKGIRATGLDLAANLVWKARNAAALEGLAVRFDEGDAEELPYPDGFFDVVMSLIGAMFAPRPELVASEMVRVCRPGGRVVMGNWTPDGHVGQMFKVIAKYAPPPAYFPSPLLWGDEATCRQRLGAPRRRHGHAADVSVRYPFPPAAVVDFFNVYYGPTNRAYAALDEKARQSLHDDLTALWTRSNQGGEGTTRVEAEYIEVVGVRRVS